MNTREQAYFTAHRLLGGKLGTYYRQFQAEDSAPSYTAIYQAGLRHILAHSVAHVPYYRELAAERGISLADDDPTQALAHFPILTKDHIRAQLPALTSDDIGQRKWYYNTSGGSTGEPVRLIQDQDFHARQDALQLLCSAWTGAQVGEPQVSLWGAEREVLQGTIELKYRLANAITNRTLLNAYAMTTEHMRQYIEVLNTKRPKLIIAYVQAIYELSRFAAREGLALQPQRAIITSAGTLYPFMRATIEEAFACPIYNRYGSREVGDIACECAAHQDLHVLPWGAYVEVVDEAGAPVPAGTEGRLLVTSLYNEVMPLIRYDIGDRGALAPEDAPPCACGRGGQRLARISGRNSDMFVTKTGALVDGTYFHPYSPDRPASYDWIWKFQVIQERVDLVRYLIVKTDAPCPEADLDEIRAYVRSAMGADCAVHFEFVDEIPLLASGKYRFTISLVEDRGGVGQDQLVAAL